MPFPPFEPGSSSDWALLPGCDSQVCGQPCFLKTCLVISLPFLPSVRLLLVSCVGPSLLVFGHAKQTPKLNAHSGTVYVSGQIPIDLSTNAVVDSDDITVQTHLVLSHLKSVLEAAGSSMDRVLKTTVLMKDMEDFAKMNAVYAEAFGDHRPARAAFQVGRGPWSMEIDPVPAAIL